MAINLPYGITIPMVSVLDYDAMTQTTVLVLQMGDGVSNIIFRTVGVLLGGLAIAGIPYVRWIKWVFSYFLLIVSVGVIFLIIARLITNNIFRKHNLKKKEGDVKSERYT